MNQFALTGLSDSANVVLMFEKFGLSARLAYNWRDEFLQNVNQGGWRNPIFVEEYDQIDLSVGYDINDNFAVSFEAINLTGEDVRWHGRSEQAALAPGRPGCALRRGSPLQVLSRTRKG